MLKKTNVLVSSLFILFLIWVIVAKHYGNDVLIPGPKKVLSAFFGLFSSSDNLMAIGHTFIRLCVSLVIAYGSAIVCAAVSVRFKAVGWFLNPAIIVLRTIPVISVIVIILIIVGFTAAPYLITFLIVFPLVYEGIKHALEHIDEDLKDVYALEDGRYLRGLFVLFFPLIAPKMRSVFLQSAGLGVKVLVMAEYLSQTDASVGNELYLAKINLAFDDVFAWTICLVLFTVLLEMTVRHMRGYTPKQYR